MKNKTDEDEVKYLLMSEGKDFEKGFKKFFDDTYVGVVHFIREEFFSFTSQDLWDILQDTYKGFLLAVRSAGFDWDGRLTTILYSIAFRKAVDHLRKQRKREPIENLDQKCRDIVAGHDWGEKWLDIIQGAEVNDVIAKLRMEVPGFPPRQRQIAQIIVDYLPDDITREEIRAEIFHRTGERLTIPQIKSALKEVRDKFRKYFREKGA